MFTGEALNNGIEFELEDGEGDDDDNDEGGDDEGGRGMGFSLSSLGEDKG